MPFITSLAKSKELETARSFNLHGFEIRDILSKPDCVIYRPVMQTNSLVDGYVPSDSIWDGLRLARAWVDGGPSPAGNTGPYLQAPRYTPNDKYVHRIYSKFCACDVLWAREKYFVRDDQILFEADYSSIETKKIEEFRAGSNTSTHPISGKIPWIASSRMNRNYSRLNIRVLNLSVQRMDRAPHFSDFYRPSEFSRVRMNNHDLHEASKLPGKVHSVVWSKAYDEYPVSENPWVWVFKISRLL